MALPGVGSQTGLMEHTQDLFKVVQMIIPSDRGDYHVIQIGAAYGQVEDDVHMPLEGCWHPMEAVLSVAAGGTEVGFGLGDFLQCHLPVHLMLN